MTDADIQSLIDAAKTSSSDVVTWAELKAILEGLKGQVSLTDLGTPVNGKVAGVSGGAWGQIDAPTASGPTALDDLTDVNVAGAPDGRWLQKVSGQWAASSLPTVDLPGGLWAKSGSWVYPASGEYVSFGGVPTFPGGRITHVGSGANQGYVSEMLIPANYGTDYGVRGVAGYFSRGWQSFDSVNASGRPNVVGTIWGYNHDLGGGRINTSEAAFALRTETHFETGGKNLVELHLPVMIDLTGHSHRLCSWYIPKDGTSAGGPRYETNALELFKWGDDIGGSYFYVQQNGQMSLKSVESPGFTPDFPAIFIGSDLSTINGVTSSLWNARWLVQGAQILFGHANTSAALTDIQVRVQLHDNLWLGGVTGFGGNANDQRYFVHGGVYILDCVKDNDYAQTVYHRGTQTGIATFRESDSIESFTVHKQAIKLKNGTTAQRPSSPENGMMRYNTSTNKFEGYAGGAWVDLH